MKLNSYVAWFGLAPLALVPATFTALCVWECSVGPWATLFVAPIVMVVFWVGLTAYLFLTTRTLEKREAALTRGPAVFIFLMGVSALSVLLYAFFRK